ncbi:MAG: ABC transporter permease [Gemmatimonadota bacterium]
MDSFRQQIRHAVRKLLRAPLFSAIALLTLAVGIGSNAAIFSVVNGVLLKPLPFEDPDELVGVWHTAPGLGFEEVNQSPALHFTYVADSRAFASVGMWDPGQASVTGLAEPEQVDAMWVTHQTLPLLRVRPMLGRTFTPEEDHPDGPQTVILSHGYWQRRFGGDPGVLGQTVSINGITREVIGVMAADLHFLSFDSDIYLPFRFDPDEVFVGNFSYQAVARLNPGSTIESANADVERMIPIAAERYPGGISLGMMREAQFGPNVRPLKQDVVGDVGSVLWVLLGTVAIVLLIACANVANLFLVRAEGKQQEMAVRTAMGASKGRLTGEMLVESLVLGVGGGALGLALAYGGLKLLVALGPESLPRLDEIGIDGLVLVFTLGVSVLAGALFGLFPALRYGGAGLVNALKEGGRGGSAGRDKHVARNALVVAQMALALVLLTGSGLMVRSFQALRSVEPGFEKPEEVVTFRVTIPSAEIEEGEQVALAHQEILRRIEAVPGVRTAAFSSSVTMDGWDSNDAVEVESNPVEGDQIPPIRRFKWVGGGYTDVMGNDQVAGRAITWADIQDRAKVVVVTENLAREEWGDPQAALGQRIRQFGSSEQLGEGAWHEVVGVVGDIYDEGVDQDPVATVYWPQVVTEFWDNELYTPRSMGYAIRTLAGSPTILLPQLREAVWSVNPNLPLARVRTLDEIVADSMGRTSFTLILLGIAAAVALFLGSVGIYGVISYIVSQRTREIGVRMALGAERSDVSGMVLKQAGVMAFGGVVIGLAASAGLTRLMSSLLYGVSPLDPLTFGSVALALSAVALIASWIPARRAARTDPVVSLRFE